MRVIDDALPLSRVGRAATGGLLVALSVPPWGFWPLAGVGLALLAGSLPGLTLRRRLLAGLAFGVAQFAPTLFWMGEFHLVGYAAVVLLETSFFVAACGLTPPGPGGALAFPAGVVLDEGARGVVPFGGLPMGGVPLGQAGGPLVAASRLGGSLLLTGLVALAGVALLDGWRAVRAAGTGTGGAGARRRVPVAGGAGARPRVPVAGGAGARPGTGARPRLPAAGIALGLVVVAVAGAGALAPGGRADGGVLDAAVVQGGGRRGFRAIESDAGQVFRAHVAATEGVAPPVGLVLWPENTVDVDALEGSPEAATLAGLAQRLGATVVAGVTDDVGADRFRNVAVAWSPDGAVADRYVKAHRVPFGEYVPGRALFERLVDLTVLPRDAVAGQGAPVVDTSAGRLGVAISFEVFFGPHARAAVREGGRVLLVPTNASSYSTSQVPTQEVAAARLRAWETGRWVLQSAPTGYSAVIDHEGRVLARSVLGRPAVLTHRVPLRTGLTPYARWGDAPVLALAGLALGAAWAVARRGRGRGLSAPSR